MSAISKLLPAVLAGTLVVSFADGASATPKRLPLPSDPAPVAVEQQAPPARLPRQFFPENRVQPLTPEIEQSLIPKDSFKECDVCPEMVVVPKGSFMMGTPADEPDRFKGEDPIHRVSLCKTVRCQPLHHFVRRLGRLSRRRRLRPQQGRRQGFWARPHAGAGHQFRGREILSGVAVEKGRPHLSAAERIRARIFYPRRRPTPFWFGNTVTAQDANYKASIPYGAGPRGEDSKGPVVVDSYAPNPFGLYQVHGNVFEWTEDCFNKRYDEDQPVDGSPWLEGDCNKRMLRGGTWDWMANMIRAGYRENAIIDGGGHSFRVVRTLNVQP